jgi:hypothetical protein
MKICPLFRKTPVLICLCAFSMSNFSGKANGQNAYHKTLPLPEGTNRVWIPFESHDGYKMLDELILPQKGKPNAIVIQVQLAEATMIRGSLANKDGKIVSTADIFIETLPDMNVAFFSYEGRGAGLSLCRPGFEEIDWKVYNTSTIDNKVNDVISAVSSIRKLKGHEATKIILYGHSEGSIIAVQVAKVIPNNIHALVLSGTVAIPFKETLKYLITDGAFLIYRRFLDTNKDGKITREEFKSVPDNIKSVRK